MPDVEEYLEGAAKLAVEEGYSKTIGGRVRRYSIPNLQDLIAEIGYAEAKNKYDGLVAHVSNCGKNSPIQGTNGDIIKLALANLRKDIKFNKRNVKLINTVHDEIIFEGPNMKDYEPIAVEIMLNAEANYLKLIPPRVDSNVDICWAK